jgi:hypothetical protein
MVEGFSLFCPDWLASGVGQWVATGVGSLQRLTRETGACRLQQPSSSFRAGGVCWHAHHHRGMRGAERARVLADQGARKTDDEDGKQPGKKRQRKTDGARDLNLEREWREARQMGKEREGAGASLLVFAGMEAWPAPVLSIV